MYTETRPDPLALYAFIANAQTLVSLVPYWNQFVSEPRDPARKVLCWTCRTPLPDNYNFCPTCMIKARWAEIRRAETTFQTEG